MSRDTTACFKIRPETRDRLRAYKRGGETYDELLERLMDTVETPEHIRAEADA